MLLCFSGVAGEGCGVIVEGSAAITEEAVATPPAGDSKASIAASFFVCFDLILFLNCGTTTSFCRLISQYVPS